MDVRGGQNFEDNILHYEVDVNKDVKIYLPNPFSKLTFDDSFVKAVVKKCLKPNRFYKISNRGLLEIVDQMLEFRKKDATRIISYDTLILALLTYGKPMSFIIYEGTRKMAQKFRLLRRCQIHPLIISLVLGITAETVVNLAGRNLFISFFATIPTWFGFYRVTEYSRNRLAIDCTDYVPLVNIKLHFTIH